MTCSTVKCTSAFPLGLKFQINSRFIKLSELCLLRCMFLLKYIYKLYKYLKGTWFKMAQYMKNILKIIEKFEFSVAKFK